MKRGLNRVIDQLKHVSTRQMSCNNLQNYKESVCLEIISCCRRVRDHGPTSNHCPIVFLHLSGATASSFLPLDLHHHVFQSYSNTTIVMISLWILTSNQTISLIMPQLPNNGAKVPIGAKPDVDNE